MPLFFFSRSFAIYALGTASLTARRACRVAAKYVRVTRRGGGGVSRSCVIGPTVGKRGHVAAR